MIYGGKNKRSVNGNIEKLAVTGRQTDGVKDGAGSR